MPERDSLFQLFGEKFGLSLTGDGKVGMVFAEVLAQNSFGLACQPRSSKMVLRHTDLSTTEADYITVDRTKTSLAIEKLEATLGKEWARKENQYSSKLKKLRYFSVS